MDGEVITVLIERLGVAALLVIMLVYFWRREANRADKHEAEKTILHERTITAISNLAALADNIKVLLQRQDK